MLTILPNTYKVSLEQVICEGGPSVNKNELKTYEESRKHIDPAIRHTASLNQIGFR